MSNRFSSRESEPMNSPPSSPRSEAPHTSHLSRRIFINSSLKRHDYFYNPGTTTRPIQSTASSSSAARRQLQSPQLTFTNWSQGLHFNFGNFSEVSQSAQTTTTIDSYFGHRPLFRPWSIDSDRGFSGALSCSDHGDTDGGRDMDTNPARWPTVSDADWDTGNFVTSGISLRQSYSQPISFNRPARYVIIQAFKNRWNAALIPTQSEEILRQAPTLLRLDADAGFEFSERGRRYQHQDLTPQILDEVDVFSYATVYIDGAPLPFQSFYNTDIAETLASEQTRPSSIMASGIIDLTSRAVTHEVVAVIQSCIISRSKRRIRPSIQFVSRYHESQLQIRDYQIDLSRNSYPQPGSFAHSLQVVLEPGMQVGSNFILPWYHGEQRFTRRIEDNEKFSYVVSLIPVARDDDSIKVNPLENVAIEDLRSTMRKYEDVLLAVCAFMQNRIKMGMEATAYIGSEFSFDGNILQITVPSGTNSRLFATRIKYWECNCRMVLKVTQPDTTQCSSSQCINTARKERIATGTLSRVEIIEYGTLTAEIRFEDEQFALAQDLCEEVLCGEKMIKIHPDSHFTGYEFRLERFRYRGLSRAMSRQSILPNRFIIQELMGIPNRNQRSLDQIIATAPAVQFNHPLNEQQTSVIQALLANVPVIYQQAPAGTGKTYVIAAYISQIFDSLADNEIIILTASTNLAVINMACAVLQMTDSGPYDALFLQSVIAERLYPRQNDPDENAWAHNRIPERLNMQMKSRELTEDDLDFVSRYVEYRLCHRRGRKNESRAMKITVHSAPPKIVFGTVAMIEMGLMRFSQRTSRLICDDASLIPESQLLALVSSIHGLRQLFLTGDARSLPTYRANVPECIIPYGLRGTVVSVTDRNVVPIISLNQSFRSHPILTQCLSHASYDNELTTTITPDNRSLLTSSSFSLPVQSIPIVLLHAPGASFQDLCLSRYNPEQEEVARTLLLHICRHVYASSIVILCFYLGTKKMILKNVDLPGNCEVHTVDSYHGREAEIVILITTRIRSILDDDADQMLFFHNNQRITAALSRARQGLLIIGDFFLLMKNEVWKRYVERASVHTPIVGKRYLEALSNFQGGHQRLNGLLLAPNGKSILADLFPQNDRWLLMMDSSSAVVEIEQ